MTRLQCLHACEACAQRVCTRSCDRSHARPVYHAMPCADVSRRVAAQRYHLDEVAEWRSLAHEERLGRLQWLPFAAELDDWPPPPPPPSGAKPARGGSGAMAAAAGASPDEPDRPQGESAAAAARPTLASRHLRPAVPDCSGQAPCPRCLLRPQAPPMPWAGVCAFCRPLRRPPSALARSRVAQAALRALLTRGWAARGW
jgi:hypothetical protein